MCACAAVIRPTCAETSYWRERIVEVARRYVGRDIRFAISRHTEYKQELKAGSTAPARPSIHASQPLRYVEGDFNAAFTAVIWSKSGARHVLHLDEDWSRDELDAFVSVRACRAASACAMRFRTI